MHNFHCIFFSIQLRKEISEVQSSVSLVKKHHEEDDEEEDDEDKIIIDPNLPNYLLGSLSTDFGVDTSLLSSQLELHSREEKINQIILLKVGGFSLYPQKISETLYVLQVLTLKPHAKQMTLLKCTEMASIHVYRQSLCTRVASIPSKWVL